MSKSVGENPMQQNREYKIVVGRTDSNNHVMQLCPYLDEKFKFGILASRRECLNPLNWMTSGTCATMMRRPGKKRRLPTISLQSPSRDKLPRGNFCVPFFFSFGRGLFLLRSERHKFTFFAGIITCKLKKIYSHLKNIC